MLGARVSSKHHPSQQFARESAQKNHHQLQKIPFKMHTRQNNKSFVETGNVVADLINFARFHTIPKPVVTILERNTKQQRRPQFDCKIKIDGQLFSSYGPDEFYDEQSAKNAASKEALTQLIQRYGRDHKSALPVSEDTLIILRIPEMVSKHLHGVWSWQVEADYKDLYKQTLPSNWVQLVGATSMITAEEYDGKFVLCIRRPENVDIVQKLRPIIIPGNSACFDQKGFMVAKVTCTISAGEIWCQQLGTQETASFMELENEMNKYYQESYETYTIEASKSVTKGKFYAAWNNIWLRVRVLEMQGDEALCFLVDYGKKLMIQFDSIFALQEQFTHVPAQSFVCRLADLEACYETSQIDDAFMTLKEGEVKLEVMDQHICDDGMSKIFSVVMYDIQTGESLNKNVKELIAMKNASHSFKIGKIFEVYVTYIPTKVPLKSQGTFYAQVQSPAYNFLNDMMMELENNLIKDQSDQITHDNYKDNIYIAKLEDDTRYHRVQIINTSHGFEYINVQYIDHGRTRVVRTSDAKLHSLDTLSPILCKFPPQVILVRMHLKTIPDNLTMKMKELIPKGVKVLLRVEAVNADGIPSIMLFVPGIGGVISVNDSVSMQMFSKETQISTSPKLASPISPHTIPSTGILQCPDLPKPREYYDVKIPFAVNPSNFFVQPMTSSSRLVEMMTRLQATFANEDLDSVNLEDLSVGNIYAAKHTDDMWYRVCVLKIMYPTAIVVFYVDYGYHANLNYMQLFPLDKQFLLLPYQAIKAKLAGINPMGGEYTPQNGCYFKQLVQQREFVAVIMAIEKDQLCPKENVLLLKLVDTTSSRQDVLINELLIQGKIAVPATTL